MRDNITDFEEYKKKRIRKKIKKRLFLITLIFIILGVIYFFYKNEYHLKAIDNINVISKSLKKSSGFPVDFNIANIKGKAKINNEILILGDDMVYIFNKYGAKTLYNQHGLTDPRVVSNQNRSVIFEHLGKKLNIYSKTSLLLEKELDNMIYNVKIFKNNKMAIIKDSNQFMSSLEIWGADYNPIFTWNSADQYIIDVAFSGNNKNFAVGSLNVKNVKYISTINFFNLSRDKKLKEISLDDEMIISMEYKRNNLYVIGSKNCYMIDNRGEIKEQYSYHNRNIISYDNENKNRVILLFNNFNEIDSDIVFLDGQLKEVGEQRVKGSLKDISSNNREVYILTDESVYKYLISSELSQKYKVDPMISNIIAIDNRLYQFNISKIDILK